MGWWQRGQVINGRVILWCLVFLLLFDLAVRAGENLSFAADIQRLPADDQATVARWKDQLQTPADFKVVFIGDSIVFGGGVKEAADTLPAYFARQIQAAYPRQNIRVVNCSLPGNTPADAWAMSRYLTDVRPDLVIYDANLGWFGSQKVMEHPGLAGLTGVNLRAEDWRFLQVTPPPAAGLETGLSRAVARFWALYRDRVFLNYWWWGQPVNEKIQQAMQYKSLRLLLPHQRNPEQQLQLEPWYAKDTASLENSRGVLGSVELGASNPHWYYYRQLLAHWRQQGVPMAVFGIPRNQTLLTQYKVINEQRFAPNQRKLLTEAAEQGALIFDYTWGVVDDRDFTDTVHPTARGNRELSRRLYQDLAAAGLFDPLAAKER